MTNIIRTSKMAKGGITSAEKKKLDKHAKLWISRIMRTEAIEPKKITKSLKALYKVSNLKEPRIIIVPSPLVAYLAGGLSAAVLYMRKKGIATDAATYAATDAATRDATRDATRAATRDATDAATSKKSWLLEIVKKFTPNAVEFSLGCIKLSWKLYQGGNMWGQYDSYLTAMRDILGLTGLPIWKKFKVWEDCAINGSWRIMHEDFCMVSDFPEFIKTDERNRPHAVGGPSHRWRDGFSIYHIQGIRIDNVKLYWKIVRDEMTPQEIFKIENTEIRRIAYEMMDKTKMKQLEGYKILDEKKDNYGYDMKIISFNIDGIGEMKYYQCHCSSTGREYFLETHSNTCEEAKSMSFGSKEIIFDNEY